MQIGLVGLFRPTESELELISTRPLCSNIMHSVYETQTPERRE
jgi:hypothetical protein